MFFFFSKDAEEKYPKLGSQAECRARPSSVILRHYSAGNPLFQGIYLWSHWLCIMHEIPEARKLCVTPSFPSIRKDDPKGCGF